MPTMLCCRTAVAVVPSTHSAHEIDANDTAKYPPAAAASLLFDDAHEIDPTVSSSTSSLSCSSSTMKSPPPPLTQQPPQHRFPAVVDSRQQAWRKSRSFGRCDHFRGTSEPEASRAVARTTAPSGWGRIWTDKSTSTTSELQPSTPTTVASAVSSAVSSSAAVASSTSAPRRKQEQEANTIDGVFRPRIELPIPAAQDAFWSEERSSLLSLKRANPVYDSDDESEDGERHSARHYDELSSPFKRMRCNLDEFERLEEEADRREEEEDHQERSGDQQEGAREASSPLAAAGPGQAFYLPENLWKTSSGAPFSGDTDDESESSSDDRDDGRGDRYRGERLFWDSRIPEASS